MVFWSNFPGLLILEVGVIGLRLIVPEVLVHRVDRVLHLIEAMVSASCCAIRRLILADDKVHSLAN